MGSTVRFGEPKCQGAVFPAERSNSSRACDVSRESSRKPFSGTLDRICACVPVCLSLVAPSWTRCPPPVASPLPPRRCCCLLLLAAAPGFRALPRSTGAIASNARHLTLLLTTAGPYPSRLLLPSLPTTTTTLTTTTTNSPYRRHHFDTPPPYRPSPSLRLHLSVHLRCPVATRLP